MSDADYGNDGDSTGAQAPKALREYADKLKAQNDELLARVQKFEAQTRKATIADALRSAEVDPKLARFVERDLEGDVTQDAVDAWLQDNGSLFGLTAKQSPEADVAAQAAAVAALSSGAPTGQAAWTPERVANGSIEELVAAGLLPKL